MNILTRFFIVGFWFLAMMGLADAILFLGPWWP